MTRLVPALAIPILMGVPIWVETSWGIGLLASVSGALCVVAILRVSPSVATFGGVFALLSLALAFRHASASTDVIGSAVFGLALLLFVDGIHLCKRFDGAAVARTFWRRQIVWWIARGAIALALAILIAVLASLVRIPLSELWAPVLAAIGALAAFASAVAFTWLTSDE
jgi:hypothetical protein